ncbi:MAG: DUF1566 domain-containing protein, partial [Desulfuromonadales bacterium]
MQRLIFAIFFLTSLFTLHPLHAATPPAQVPQTGQTLCYDAAGTAYTCTGATGQDGDYQAGVIWPNPRFVDNGDQSVTDKLTGLIWSKDANPSGGTKTWQQALDYIKTLNSSNYQGHNDWRLPNFNELASLVNKGHDNNATWLNGLGFYNVQSNYYWSGTTCVGSTTNAWFVGMSNGVVVWSGKYSYYDVWPVRSGQSGHFGALTLPKTGQTTCYDASGATIGCSGSGQDGELQSGVAWPAPRFTANADQTMTDNQTGLIWSKEANPAGGTKTWQEALDYIITLNNSNYLGHNDWRLPNRNELESLFNKGQVSSAAWLQGLGFTNVQNSWWSGTTGAGSTEGAWGVGMGNGSVGVSTKSIYYEYVWPVRSGQTWSFGSLTLSKSGSGTGSVTPDTGAITWTGTSGSGRYIIGTLVTLTATPAAGSTFIGWSGACSGSGACQITMDAVKSVTATFNITPINGTCGSSNTAILTAAPTTNLCTTGTASSVTGSGPWSWSCSGAYGGTTATCTAYSKGKPALQLPATGQTLCYDAAGATIACIGSRQDGELQMGASWPTPRFAANGDQTVTDKLTGLIWSRDGNLMKTRDPGFDTDDTAGDGAVSWQHALDYVKKLNSQKYLGYSDWRLPTVIEQESLTSKGEADISVRLNSQGFINVQAGGYWVSSSYAYSALDAWYVDMSYGYVNNSHKFNSYYVWPVRGGQSGSVPLPQSGQTVCYDAAGTTIGCSGTGQDGELQSGTAWPTPRFSDNGDSTLTDNLTGLIWPNDAKTPGPAACSPAVYKSWQGALDHVNCLNANSWLGKVDWRLPNRNEQWSLVNNGASNPDAWLNSQGFSNVQSYYYWSSSSYAYYPGYAWLAHLGRGYLDNNIKAFNSYVWPVRGGQSGAFTFLSISKSGSGSGIVTPSSGIISWSGNNGSVGYAPGTIVTLAATPATGSAFVSWSGCDSSSANQCSVTMNSSRGVTVSFKENIPPVITVIDPPNNSTRTDVWQLAASASDNIGVATVDFSVMVTISGASWYLNSGNTFTKSTTPIWASAVYDATNLVWTRDTQTVNWSDNKTYTITARARDAASNEATVTSTFTKVVVLPKDPSTLSLDLSANSIANNGSVTISG